MAQTQKKQQDMGTGDVKKLLLQLMIPAVVAQVVNLLYNIVDRIYIGHISGIGAAALTGVGMDSRERWPRRRAARADSRAGNGQRWGGGGIRRNQGACGRPDHPVLRALPCGEANGTVVL